MPSSDIRYDLCDIVFDYYKGVTFSVEALIHEKRDTLSRILDFISDNAEALHAHRSDSSFWYPLTDHQQDLPISFHHRFYRTSDGNISTVSHPDGDYFLDPLKIHFCLCCKDVRTMDCYTDNARKVLDLNLQIFSALADAVGDTRAYGGLNTLEYIRHIQQTAIDDQAADAQNPAHSPDYKAYLARSHAAFNDEFHLFTPLISISESLVISDSTPDGRTASRSRI